MDNRSILGMDIGFYLGIISSLTEGSIVDACPFGQPIMLTTSNHVIAILAQGRRAKSSAWGSHEYQGHLTPSIECWGLTLSILGLGYVRFLA